MKRREKVLEVFGDVVTKLKKSVTVEDHEIPV